MPRKTPYEYSKELVTQLSHVEACFDALDESSAYLDTLLEKSMYDLAKKYSAGFYNEVFLKLKIEIEELDTLIGDFSEDMEDL